MILTFTVKVSVEDYGEKWVPYLKDMILGSVSRFSRALVVYEKPSNDKLDEALEYDAWERGEIEL